MVKEYIYMDYKLILMVYEFETSKIAAKVVASMTTKILVARKMILIYDIRGSQCYR